MTTQTLSSWDEQVRARYREALAAGEHDQRCERRERSYICHCHKRKREAGGLTELPTADLEFPPPACPSCDRDLNNDGDGWECQTCAISWSHSGDGRTASFTDDYGTDFGGEQFGERLLVVEGGLAELAGAKA